MAGPASCSPPRPCVCPARSARRRRRSPRSEGRADERARIEDRKRVGADASPFPLCAGGWTGRHDVPQAGKPASGKNGAQRMSEIAVIGGGLMGHGIALVLALHGHGVRITDTLAETRARVPGLMASALATLQEAGAAPEGWDAERLGRGVRVEAELEPAVAGAGLVIEAITENPEAKRALFAALDRL